MHIVSRDYSRYCQISRSNFLVVELDETENSKQWRTTIMRSPTIIALFVAIPVGFQSANAETADGVKIPARLECSALIPKRSNDSAFVSQIVVSYSGRELSAERPRIVGSGVERFTGTIDPLGRIEMTAKYEDKQSWIYRLKGRLEEKAPTVLKGDVQIITGAIGRRNCSITFLPKPDELMAAFSR